MEVLAEKVVQNKPVPRGRSSVSAEVYGTWNKPQLFVPKVVPKDNDIREALRQKLTESFMFRALDTHNLKIVIDAMEEVKFNKGDLVIK